MTTASDRLFVATRKGVFRVTRSGAGQWTPELVGFRGFNASLVMHDPRDGAIWSALDHGHFGVKLHVSRDGGETWPEVTTPVYPEPPADYKPDLPMEGKPAPWSLKLIWALTPGGTGQPGTIWCGTIPGGLFRTDDGGESWQLNRPLWDMPERERWFGGGADWPGIHSVCVNPANADHVTVGVSCGGVWVTRDGGQTWTLQADGMRAEFMPEDKAYEPSVQDPHCVVQCPANPDVMWAQHHNGIFRTTNAGAKWDEITDVSPSGFGFPVAVHPADPDTAWFVPAEKDERRIPVDGKVVVTRTRDGGKTFQTLTEGLPADNAWDLVFRHSLDVDGTGDRLAFGSTTGSLWVSENGGDSWQHVSAHLPPVYAVCFA